MQIEFTIRTMHDSLMSEIITMSDYHGNCSKLLPRRSQHCQHQRTMDCRMRSNKSGVLVVSPEGTTIQTMKYSIITTRVSFTNDFMWSQKMKVVCCEHRLLGKWSWYITCARFHCNQLDPA
ncbi:hypothetical protein TNCV_909921 [Trichonephila clavipes]|nr:hypothetical protein TNCV_909921 [Trichonephila clavipes]